MRKTLCKLGMLVKEEKVSVFSDLQMPISEKGKPFTSLFVPIHFLVEKVSERGVEKPGGSAFSIHGGISGGNMAKKLRLRGYLGVNLRKRVEKLAWLRLLVSISQNQNSRPTPYYLSQ